MPSPFPGMDPYLELPQVFPDLHDSMIAEFRRDLNAILPFPFFSRIASRIRIESERQRIQPDINVFENPSSPQPREGSSRGGPTTQDMVLTEPLIITIPEVEVRETFLEILTAAEGERLVTAIEILSRTNKMHGSHSRQPYLAKQEQLLNSDVNLIEIDLLRGGVHTTAVPRMQVLSRFGPFDYHACIHRFHRLRDYFVYPVTLSQRLPVIAVPLLPDVPDVKIDLQDVLNRCYDTGLYGSYVRYLDWELDPPLSPERAAWVQSVLREKGILDAMAEE